VIVRVVPWSAVGLAWALVAFVGLGLFERSPEQAGCYEPRIATGVAIVSLALVGLAVAAWAPTKRRQLLGALATVVLIGGVVAAGLLAPEARFGPC
jgi:hypothetical protein